MSADGADDIRQGQVVVFAIPSVGQVRSWGWCSFESHKKASGSLGRFDRDVRQLLAVVPSDDSDGQTIAVPVIDDLDRVAQLPTDFVRRRDQLWFLLDHELSG